MLSDSYHPLVFVASSIEALPLAQAVQRELSETCRVKLWNQDIILTGGYTVDALSLAADDFDFGIFVFAPDDLSESRGCLQFAPRDNVLFECGLFFGRIGRQCSFFLVPGDSQGVKIPTDLWGIVPAQYDTSLVRSGDHRAAVGAACSAIRKSMANVLREEKPDSSLTGNWIQTWEIISPDGSHHQNKAPAIVRHIGDRFFACCHDREYPWEARGVVENGHYVTGTWCRDKGSYFGAFQFFVHPLRRRMEGQVVGFRSNNRIAHGTWEWLRQGS